MAAAANAGRTLAKFVNPNKKGAGQMMDGLASLVPLLRGPRGLVKQIFGFRGRQVNIGRGRGRPRQNGRGNRKPRGKGRRPGVTQTGGGSVTTVNAPIAFARTRTFAPGIRIAAKDPESVVVTSVDFISAVGQANAGVFNLGINFDVAPYDSTLFTWLYQVARMYTKYKLKSLKIHFEHYCPTTVQGELMITWSPDPDTAAPATNTEMKTLNSCVAGAVYEDFSYVADRKQFESDWQYISAPGGADEDDRLLSNGVVLCATANGGTTGASVGSLWIETEWIFTGRRLPTLAAAMGPLDRSLEESDPRLRRQIAFGVLNGVLDRLDTEKRGKASVKNIIHDERAKALESYKSMPPLSQLRLDEVHKRH